MERSVATHYGMVSQRSHWATFRSASNGMLQRLSGRRGKLGLETPQTLLAVPLSQPQPRREAGSRHRRDREPVQTGRQPHLVLISSQLSFSLFIELFAGPKLIVLSFWVFQYGRSRQIAPRLFPSFALPTGGVSPQWPADVPLADAWRPPSAHDRKLLHTPFAPCLQAHWNAGVGPLVRPSKNTVARHPAGLGPLEAVQKRRQLERHDRTGMDLWAFSALHNYQLLG
jgi:hypothetical protein